MDRTLRDQARRAAEQRAWDRRAARAQTRTARAEFRACERSFLARPQGLCPEVVELVASGAADTLAAGWSADLQSLKQLLDSQPTTARKDRLVRLLLVVFARDPRLRRADLLRAYGLLAEQSWVRGPEAWTPRGRGAEGRFKSLVSHLLCRWPVARFLDSAFVQPEVEEARRWVTVYARLGGGDSLRHIVGDGVLATPMTRRACALFVGARGGDDVMGALRRAQVTAWGGSIALASALRATPWGHVVTALEEPHGEWVQWMTRQPDLDLGRIREILDWARFCREDDRSFSMVGRTVASVLRGVDELAVQIARVRPSTRGGPRAFAASGVLAGEWELVGSGEFGGPAVWRMDELLSPRALVAEGRAMRHCVGGYVDEVTTGECSIWSIRREGERCLTVEVSADRRIIQARGRRNRDPTLVEFRVIRRWARKAKLTLADDFNP